MAKKTNIICKNNFRNPCREDSKEAFNRKMALLICNAENFTLKNSEARPAEHRRDQRDQKE